MENVNDIALGQALSYWRQRHDAQTPTASEVVTTAEVFRTFLKSNYTT